MINVGKPTQTVIAGAVSGLIGGQIMIPVDFVNPDFTDVLNETIAELMGLIGYLFGHALFSIFYGVVFAVILLILGRNLFPNGISELLFIVYTVSLGVVIGIIAIFGFPLIGYPVTNDGMLYIIVSHQVYAITTGLLFFMLSKRF